MYYVSATFFGRATGLIAAALLTFSPWHIMLSRWALESNLLPAVFLSGLALLTAALQQGPRRAQIILLALAGALFALCLYTYGTAYLAVPLYIVAALVILQTTIKLRRSSLIAFVLAFVILSIPIALFVAINSFDGSTMSIGPVTIPRLPSESRYAGASILGSASGPASLFHNAENLLRILKDESDGTVYNSIPRYGILYRTLLPVGAIAVLFLAYRSTRKQFRAGSLLILAWILAGLSVGLVSEVNINRANVLFVPLIIAIAGLAGALTRHGRRIPAVTCILLVGAACVAFMRTYTSPAYQSALAVEFQSDLLQAVQFSTAETHGNICVLADGNMPYVYGLFVDPIDPEEFSESVMYARSDASFRQVLSYGRYAFADCASLTPDVYVQARFALPPQLPDSTKAWSVARFGTVAVYYSQQG
jgi:4-amino-4-deoxy-L-arabinose transferase-like glycosyltransferase